MKLPEWIAREALPFKRLVARLALMLGGYHLLAGFGVRPFTFVGEGTILNLLQAFAFLSAGALIRRDVRRQTPVNDGGVPRDEGMIQAIRGRAVDNLIAVQRESQGGHA